MKLRAEQEQPHQIPLVFWQSWTMCEIKNQRRKKEAEKRERACNFKVETPSFIPFRRSFALDLGVVDVAVRLRGDLPRLPLRAVQHRGDLEHLPRALAVRAGDKRCVHVPRARYGTSNRADIVRRTFCRV